MADGTILVTGAGGFVGSRVVEAVASTDPSRVRAGLRTWANASRVCRLPVDTALCDITNPAQAADATAGAWAVVHCAYGDSRELIVEGTRTMLRAAVDAGVRRFVYLSSAEVYGREISGQISESVVGAPEADTYGAWKAEAEAVVREYQGPGLSTTILRPSIIYGPFSQSWTVRVAARLQSGNWGRFEELADGTCNLVYVDDLVRLILLALERDEADGGVFNVVGPDRPTWNEYFSRFNEVLGLPPLRSMSKGRSVRSAAVRDAAQGLIAPAVSRFRPRLMSIYLRGGFPAKVMKAVQTRLKTTVSRREHGLYGRQAEFVADAAERVLGFRPRVDLDTGLARCKAWLEFSGYVESADPFALPGEGCA